MDEDVKVEDSILLSTKKSLGLEPTMEAFDPDIIMCINSALNVLTQLGVGPVEGFSISSKEDTWDGFIGEEPRLNMVKTYIYLKTKMVFDPPTIGGLMTSYQEQIKELEWRINVQVDPAYTFDDKEDALCMNTISHITE